MDKTKVLIQVVALSGLLTVLPASAEKPHEKEERAAYRSSIQAPKGNENEAQLQKLAKITQKAAIQTASARARSSAPEHVELENEDGNVVYVVRFKAGSLEREIVVDAGNGKILADQTDKPEKK